MSQFLTDRKQKGKIHRRVGSIDHERELSACNQVMPPEKFSDGPDDPVTCKPCNETPEYIVIRGAPNHIDGRWYDLSTMRRTTSADAVTIGTLLFGPIDVWEQRDDGVRAQVYHPITPTCQQVVDDQTEERCGKPARPRMGLFAFLCDECATRLYGLVRRAWGIDANTEPEQRPVMDGCCGTPCDEADDTCFGEIDVVDEVYDEETGEYGWVHACEKHRSQAWHLQPN